MGYRFVTGSHWEVADPSSLGKYRQKWIPARYVDIRLNELNDNSTAVEMQVSYYLTKRRFKYKIDILLDSELEIIKEVVVRGRDEVNLQEEVLIKSLEKDSEFSNIVLLLALILITVLLVFALSYIPGIWKWVAVVVIVAIQIGLLVWFNSQNIRKH
ncbi:MAG: hypothetical protein ACK4KT_06315 [Thermaurantimonas sp.]